MKVLVLIRHAEAENNSEQISDFTRPLTTTGKSDAVKMAVLLKKAGTVPQTMISSLALRALTTANIFSSTLNLKEPQTDKRIYEAEVEALLAVINSMVDQNQTAALVAHNPGISNLLYYLTGKMTTMPTCAFAVISFETEHWNQVSAGTGELLQYSFP